MFNPNKATLPRCPDNACASPPSCVCVRVPIHTRTCRHSCVHIRMHMLASVKAGRILSYVLTNGLSGITVLFSSNGLLFSLSRKRHIITTGGERGKALQITAIREPGPLGASGTAFYITVDTFFETITANNELGLTGL